MAELRKDPVSGDWVVSGYTKSKLSDTGDCPFCPGNEHLTPKTIREMKGPDGAVVGPMLCSNEPCFCHRG